MIRVQHVNKAYGSTLVVEDVCLDVTPGGVTCLIGPNGAGKSTLLSIISRLLPADGGSVLVDELDVAKASSKALARRMAVLRQDNHLAVRLTVRDLVGFGRFPHSHGKMRAEDWAEVDRAIERLELQTFADRFLDELSGGQRQRAFVAMVLAQDTQYVLLDEPLNSLDLRHAASMMAMLRRAADELGKTIIIVVHDINAAAAYADEIIAMKDGRVVATGSPREIVRPEVLFDVFGLPVCVNEVRGCLVASYFGLGAGLGMESTLANEPAR